MSDVTASREELLHPYLHPYRKFLPVAMREAHVARTYTVAGAAAVGGFGATALTGSPLWGFLGVVVTLYLLALVLKAVLEATVVIYRFSKPWDDTSELGTIRARRLHAGEHDRELVHPEYAVTVEDTGHLWIWRFDPLPVMDVAPPGTVLVPGRPRYAASMVEERAFDPDATRAAEELVEAQERAAELEQQARDAARRQLSDAAQRREIDEETASTAAALKHLTGQRPSDESGARRRS